ncbi:MAG: leucyl aminopeptidase [Cyanobacteria bacterium NC_groundwater_1444_Ag_S-0.65um_54_12]|nr:leucyl aminopeptidase [Cyanobacteria bacterium NC_groundwater_1444_Ag_S-0.65um_54_12]
MKFEVKATKLESAALDVIVAGLFEDEKNLPEELGQIDVALAGLLTDLLASGEFTGKAGAQLLLPTAGKISARWILLLGLGKTVDYQLDKLRQAVARAVQAARDSKLSSLGCPALGAWRLANHPEAMGQVIAEGAYLGLYQYEAYKTEHEDAPKRLESLTLLVKAAELTAMAQGVESGEKIAKAVCFSRDLIQTPARDMTPAILAERAASMAREISDINCRILVEEEITQLKMGALLGVARGTLGVQPPRFIILEYFPKPSIKPLVLVGKGITFDSGGISLKPAEGMEKMKYDMSGGAAVIGALRAIAELQLPVNVVGLIPATENMPSGNAIHPGDILTAMSGKTIEVVNTDAEGRLILSDALTYAERYEPAAVVDLATLTGACVIALGHQAIAVLGNNQPLIDRIRAAGDRSGERTWQLPLWEEYSEQIKSDIADMKNSGGRPGGTITAAALLAKFAGNYPWAHLDIAGTAWEEKGRPYAPKGATGIGVRLLVELAKDFAGMSSP